MDVRQVVCHEGVRTRQVGVGLQVLPGNRAQLGNRAGTLCASGLGAVCAAGERRAAVAGQLPGSRFRQYALSACTLAAVAATAYSAGSWRSSVLVIQPTRTRSSTSLVP